MAERCVKGDYIGFTFGDVHSSELGLMRVSNGSRYEQDLLPPLQDKTVQVNGRDGAVYFNSTYNTRPIKVPVAFDNMTEESFQKLKELLMDKKPKYLWFDETPYKQWLVKSANAQNFKWVCFDESQNIERINDGDSEGTKKRIYKGEGTLEFSCFTPYAESRVTFLDDPVDSVWVWNREKSPRRLIKQTKIENALITWKKISTQNSLDTYNSIVTSQLTIGENDHPYRPISIYDSNGVNWGLESVQNDFLETGGIFLWGNPINNMRDIGKIKKDEQIITVSGDRCVLILTQQDDEYGWTGFLNWHTALGVVQFWSLNSVSDLNGSVGIFDKNAGWERTVICITKTSNGNYYGVSPIYNENNKLIEILPDYSKPVIWITYNKPQTTLENNYNSIEWKNISKLRKKEEIVTYDTILQKTFKNEDGLEILESSLINVYNVGDKETNIFINFLCDGINKIDSSGTVLGKTFFTYLDPKDKKQKEELHLYKNYIDGRERERIKTIVIEEFVLKDEDNGFILDSKLKIIKGTKNGKPTGNIYSKFHIGGDYFKIPVCTDKEYYTIESVAGNGFTVDYKHYYI